MKIFLKTKFGIKKLLNAAVDFWVSLHPPKRKVDGKKILIVKIDRVGDFLLFSPAFALIKKAFPDYKITACVSPAGKAILDNLGTADETIAFDRKKFNGNSAYRYRLLKRIRRGDFEKAIYPAYSREPIGDHLVKMSGAKEKIGSSGDTSNIGEKQKKENDKHYTKLVPQTDEATHEIERNKDFLEKIGIPAGDYEIRLNISEKDAEAAEEIASRAGVGKIIAVAPGARDEKRRWNAENFALLSKKLLEHFGEGLVLVVGGEEDAELGEKIRELLGRNAANLAGKANFSLLFAVLKRADIFIGNDSAPLHFASAVGTPTLEISCHPKGGTENHPNSPARFGPYGVPNAVLQPEPDERCKDFCGEKTARFINKITVEEAFETAKKLLK